MERLFLVDKCDRCGGSLADGRIMSMYNTEIICMKCKAAERRRADYNEAAAADHEAVKAGNYNFAGIGLKPETYQQMKERHQNEVNALPLAFAFSKDRYLERLAEWGISEEAARNGAIVGIGGGGFVRAEDHNKVLETFKRIREEEQAAIKADLTGDGYIYQMFLYELNNHEFSYTGDVDDTLNALGISEEDIDENDALRHGLNMAIREINGSSCDTFDE